VTKVTLYTRLGCHLCDEAKNIISAVRHHSVFDYEELDIDSDPGLRQLYNEEVPVIAIDGAVAFRSRLTEEELLQRLAGRS